MTRPSLFAARYSEIRAKAERAIVYPVNRDDALWLCEQLDGVLSASTADEWLSHRFNQVCDELESLKAEKARPCAD